MRDYPQTLTAKRRSDSNDQYTCLFPTTNGLNLPDYIVVPVVYTQIDPNNPDAEFQATQFYTDYSNGNLDIANYTNLKNTELTPEVLAAYRYAFEEFRNFGERNVWNRGVPAPNYFGPNDPDFFNEPSYNTTFSTPFPQGLLFNQGGIIFNESNTFFTKNQAGDVIKNYVMTLAPINQADCAQTQGVLFDLYDPVTGNPLLVDGIGLDQPGYVEGTPTAILTDNQIEQIVDGMSLQLNWNFEKHKVMLGASIDSASADYSNYQQLGFLTVDREAYLDPEQAHPQFAGAYVPLANNNFDGTNVTKSIYFSETWTPIETLHFTAAGRYNQTKTKNKIAARSGFLNYGIGDLIAEPDLYNVCPDTDGNGTVTTSDCAGIPLNYRPLRLDRVLDPEETEKFSYYSFNPSLGVSWQAKENLNIYANIAKGTRTPSVIELGCALDKTPVGPFYKDGNGNLYQQPKSVAENRQCTLPTTLSGDPYLPQIRATTYDIGMRGMLSESLQWNLGAYQTDLKDDIYYVAVGGGQGFFDSIGDTRRRGIEAGISGKKDKFGFALNYALTEATFENSFYMYAEDNSSAKDIAPLGPGVIQVNKGNRMPGSALHNLNATVSYEVTPDWKVSLNTVMHSDSYVRGNENNEHKQGVQRVVPTATGTRLLAPTRNPGTVPGYAVFNFQTSYKLSKEWTATMLINNLFDQEYFTAGRLGRNPFSPSVLGAIGPDGYNHNSGDWMSTNFIAPGAPRGIWFSLNWHFVPD